MYIAINNFDVNITTNIIDKKVVVIVLQQLTQLGCANNNLSTLPYRHTNIVSTMYNK